MPDNINLLPWRELQRKARRQRFACLCLATLMVVLGTLWGGGWYVDRLIAMQEHRLDFLRQSLNPMDEKQATLTLISGGRDDLLARLKRIESLQRKRNRTTQLMSLMGEWIPEGIYIDNMTMNDGQVEIRGSSDSTSRLMTMLNNLETSDQLSDVNMHSIASGERRADEPFQHFTVSFQFHTRSELAHNGVTGNRYD